MNLALIIIISLTLAAFLTAMEIAWIKSNKISLETGIKQKTLITKLLGMITAERNQYITAMLLINIVNLLIFTLLYAYLLEKPVSDVIIRTPGAMAMVIVLSTGINLLLALMLPKKIFRFFPWIIIKLFSLPVILAYYLLYPLVSIYRVVSGMLVNLILNRQKKSGNADVVFNDLYFNKLSKNSTIKDFRNKISMEKEVQLFRNALDFSKVKLREIMVPRPEIVMLEVNAEVSELKQKFVETGYSRILIYNENIDNIIGYVPSSVIFQNPGSIKPYVKNVLMVPETMAANKLLGTFIKEHRSIAIVVDEFGGTAGMVTTEDILEEIFGEIEDEHDTVDIIEKQISPDEYIFSGRAEIDLLNEKYQFNLPENEEYETLAGLILYLYESFPKIHTEITIDNYQLKILKASSTKIELVKLTLLKE